MASATFQGVAQLKTISSDPAPQWQRPAVILAVIIVVAALLRLPGLGDGLDHDEAYTWLAFASQPVSVIVGHYPVPNNHILHSLLMALSASAFGESEVALRLPALLAGLLGVAATWWLAQAMCRNAPQAMARWWVPALAAALLAINPTHIGWSQSARGYSLLVLFAALSGGALLGAQLQRRRPLWPVYSACLFLALYTQPVAVLLAVGLAAWSLWHAARSGDQQLLTSALSAHGAVGLACILAYGRIWELVVGAGQAWGIDLHDGSFVAAFGLLRDVAMQSEIPALAAALLGVVFLRRHGLSAVFASLAAAAMLIPLVYGVAPQARGYVYLLPWVSVLAAFGVASLQAERMRQLALGVVLLPVALFSGLGAITHKADPGWRDLAARVNERSPRGEVLVAPFGLDVEVFHYARTAIQRGVVTSLMDGDGTALLWAVEEPRYGLGDYTMSALNGARVPLQMPAHAFEQVYAQEYAAGGRAIYKMRSTGQTVMPESWQWNAHPDEVAHISFGSAGPAVSQRPGLAVRNNGGKSFRIFSDARFRPTQPGICVLLSARSDPRSIVSIYRVVPDAEADGSEQVAELDMLTTSVRPVQGFGRDQRLWNMEAYLLPLQAGAEYGVFVRGSDAERQDFCDIRVLYFPNP